MKIHSMAIWALALALGPIGAQAQYTNYMRPGVTFNNIYAAQADITLSNMIRQQQMNSYVNGVKASMAATQGARRLPRPPRHRAPHPRRQGNRSRPRISSPRVSATRPSGSPRRSPIRRAARRW